MSDVTLTGPVRPVPFMPPIGSYAGTHVLLHAMDPCRHYRDSSDRFSSGSYVEKEQEVRTCDAC